MNFSAIVPRGEHIVAFMLKHTGSECYRARNAGAWRQWATTQANICSLNERICLRSGRGRTRAGWGCPGIGATSAGRDVDPTACASVGAFTAELVALIAGSVISEWSARRRLLHSLASLGGFRRQAR